MNTEIYYFSGTGNSLHVAKELQKRIPETHLIPMLSLLDQETIAAQEKCVGFVFPIYLMLFPKTVKRFLEKINLQSAEYIFAVLTLIGSPILADIYLEKILKEKGKSLDAYFNVKMSSNSPSGVMPVYLAGDNWPPSEKRMSGIESAVQKKLDQICQVIINQEKNPQDDFPRFPRRLLKRMILPTRPLLEKQSENATIDFYADSSCIGCGTCESVCSSQKIKMTDGKAVWQDSVPCYFCYACFAYCPEQAILVRKVYERKNGRSFHPEITSDDIAGQKSSP
jgi:ferredoxin/flavodoxin